MNHEDIISKASIELLRKLPFYAHILTQLARIYTKHETPTFCVGKSSKDDNLIKLYINTDYVESCFNGHNEADVFKHIIEVLKHEILHIVFNHLCYNMPDKKRAAIAFDLSVNSYINRSNLLNNPDGTPGGMFPCDYKFEEKQSFMWYYKALLDNDKFKQQQKNQKQFDEAIDKILKSHDLWEAVKDSPETQDIIKDLVRHATKITKETNAWDSVPGDIRDQIDDLIKPAQPLLTWNNVLKQFVGRSIESVLDYTMKKRSRRFGTRPGTKKEDVLRLVIGLDVSGSVDNEMLKRWIGELYWIEKTGATVDVCEFDTRVGKQYKLSEFDGNIYGGGGTDLEPMLKHATENGYDALVCFTDMYAPIIETIYSVPVLWVVSNNSGGKDDFPYKRGLFIRMIDDNHCEIIK